MNVREQLERLNYLNEKLEDKQSRREKMVSAATNVTARLEGDRVQTSGDKDRIGTLAGMLVDLDKEIAVLLEEYSSALQVVFDMMLGLEKKDHYDVIFHRFIEHKSVEETADIMCRSVDHTKRLQRDAIAELEARF